MEDFMLADSAKMLGELKHVDEIAAVLLQQVDALEEYCSVLKQVGEADPIVTVSAGEVARKAAVLVRGLGNMRAGLELCRHIRSCMPEQRAAEPKQKGMRRRGNCRKNFQRR
jgi:hypothetical protein